jgi:excinuclease UvrABC nuclease subunit
VEILEFMDVSVLGGPGVYMLLHGPRIVYVGKTKHLSSRLYTHYYAARRGKRRLPFGLNEPKRMHFNGVKILPLPIDQLDEVECSLIEKYRPHYNSNFKPSPPELSHLFQRQLPPPKPNPYQGRRL